MDGQRGGTMSAQDLAANRIDFVTPIVRARSSGGRRFDSLEDLAPMDILSDSRVVKSDGCWLWTGYLTRGGYGRLYIGSYRYEYTHRLAYEEAVGPIPDGLELDHLCRNHACCNPAHLEAVTHRENIRRGAGPDHCRRLSAAKSARPACPRGHLWTEANTYTRPSGRRYCRTCVGLKIAQRRAA